MVPKYRVWYHGKPVAEWELASEIAMAAPGNHPPMDLVLAQMRRDVNATTRIHPLANASMELNGSMLVVVLPRSRTVLFDTAKHDVSEKERLMQTLFSSSLSALVDRPSCKSSAILRPTAFLFKADSKGCLTEGCRTMPTLVIAKMPLLGRVDGIHAPNPYFKAFDSWTKESGKIINATVSDRESRIPRVLWRGNVHSPSAGVYERAAAAVLTILHPDLFDIADPTHPSAESILRRAGVPHISHLEQVPSGNYAAGLSRLQEATYVDHTDFSRWAAVVNLPGHTGNSYSKNLNYVWATASPLSLIHI